MWEWAFRWWSSIGNEDRQRTKGISERGKPMETIIALLAGVWLFGAAVKYLREREREDEERARRRRVSVRRAALDGRERCDSPGAAASAIPAAIPMREERG